MLVPSHSNVEQVIKSNYLQVAMICNSTHCSNPKRFPDKAIEQPTPCVYSFFHHLILLANDQPRHKCKVCFHNFMGKALHRQIKLPSFLYKQQTITKNLIYFTFQIGKKASVDFVLLTSIAWLKCFVMYCNREHRTTQLRI